MPLRFQSWPMAMVIALCACGDDGAGGAGGAAGSTTVATSGASSTKSASSATSGSNASGSNASGSSASASASDGASSASSTDASSATSASSTSSGQMLQLCGIDDPGGDEARCDPATEYCQEMNGGIIASRQFECLPKPAGCSGPPTCACVPANDCTCTMDGELVRITCNLVG